MNTIEFSEIPTNQLLRRKVKWNNPKTKRKSICSIDAITFSHVYGISLSVKDSKQVVHHDVLCSDIEFIN